MTPVCYIHDKTLAIAKTIGTVDALSKCDRMFFKNMVEAIFHYHSPSIISNAEHLDLLWAVSYYAAVDKAKGFYK